MNAERWDRIKSLFDAAGNVPPELRDAFLREGAAGDSGVYRQVRSLLDSTEDHEGDNIAAVLGDAAQAALQTLPSMLQPADRIGPYQILGELGRGGMGSVYKAIRADDAFHKEFAIKCMRPSVLSAETLLRFRGERQILADLDHPNIARMVDGGTAPAQDTTGRAGLPYVVMEFVDGVPIDEFADARKLTIEARLRLFLPVASAVAYAHRNLVVHRDLKPANILVTNEGVPKLLDFGIAKLLEPGLAPHTVAVTQAHVRLMTPAYASPEQILGKPITTASDVYSLGVVLYELLVGRRPYRIVTGDISEYERAVVTEEPERPSTAVLRNAKHQRSDGSDRDVNVETVSASRGVDSERLRRTLRGDLDNILLKALEKDPARRYASIEQFRDDIERFLDGRTVLARPQSLGYRAGKFVRRNRPLVAAVAAALAVVVSLVVFYTVRLRQERDLAKWEARKADQVASFLTSIFEQADPDQAQGTPVTAEQILERGAARLETELASQPAVRAVMFNTIGRVYRTLGKYDRSHQLLNRSLAELEKNAPDASAELARVHFDLGELAHYREQYDEAGKHYERALALYQGALGRQHGETARVLDLLGRIRWRQGKREEGERMQAEALATRILLFGEHSLEAAESYHSIGMREGDAGRKASSAEYFERELAVMDRHGREFPALLNNLASVYGDLGRRTDAERMFERALASTEKTYGEKHPYMVLALSGAAHFIAGAGDPEKALKLYTRAREIAFAAEGGKGQRYIFSQNNIGRILINLGRFGEAELVLREGEALTKAAGAQGRGQYADVVANFRELYLRQGRLDDALRYAQLALDLDVEMLSEAHPYVAVDYLTLARIADRANRFDEAEKHYRKALMLRTALDANNDMAIAIYKASLGEFLVDRGRHTEAHPLLEASLQSLRKAHPEGHVDVARTENALGACLAALGKKAAATPLLRQSEEFLRNAGDRYKERAAKARQRLLAFERDASGGSTTEPLAEPRR